MRVRTAGIIIVAVLLLVGATVLLFARLYLTPEKVRQSLFTSIEGILGGNISCESISTSIFEGVCIRGITFKGHWLNSGEQMVSCEEVRFTCSLPGLLLKKLVILDVVVKNPRLVWDMDTVGTRQRVATGQLQSEAAPSLHVVFLPQRISLQGGSLVVSSPSLGLRIPFDRISLQAPDISLLVPFTVTATAYREGATEPTLTCSGTYWFARNEVRGTITVQDADTSTLKPLLAAAGVPYGAGALNITVRVSGSPTEKLNAAVQTSLDDGVWGPVPVFEQGGSVSLEDIDATFSGNATWDATKKICAFEDITGTVWGAAVRGNAALALHQRAPLVRLELNAEAFPLDALCERLHVPEGSPLQGLKLAGTAGVRFLLETTAAGMASPSLAITLRDNAILYPALRTVQPRLSGTVHFDTQRIKLADVRLGTKNLSVTLRGDVAGYLHGSPRSSVRVVSSQINLVEMLNPAAGEQADDIGPFDFKGFSFRGPLQFGQTSWMGLSLGTVRGSYLFEKNKFMLREMRGTVADQGTFTGEMTIDFGVRGLAYSTRLVFGEVPITALRGLVGFDLSPFCDGAISGVCTVSGRGTTPTGFIEQLTGDAEVMLEHGRVKGLGLPPQLLTFLKSDASKDISFSNAQLHLRLANGTIRLVDGALLSPNIQIFPSGALELDGSLDLTATLKIQESFFAEGSRLASYLPHADGWVTLPVLIKGTINRPRIALSDEAMDYLLQETLPRLLMDFMGQPAPREQGDNATGEEQP